MKDNEGNFTRRGYSLALWESADGFHWKLASHPLVATPEVKWADGRTVKLDALERPQLLFENGEPIALYCAAADRKGRDGSFNVQIPLKTLGLGARADRSEVSVGVQSYPSYPGMQAVPLAQVRLLPGEFKLRQDLHRRVILSYNPDRLLHNFRVNAGLPSNAKPFGGWESPGVGLRGHFTGHYLSACALMYAATGDPQFKERADLLVAELAKCQDALGDGYLSAFPASQFDVLETKFFEGVWAPYYTIHKIMAGLLDAHEQTGNRQALAVAMRMAGYFGARISKLSPEAVEKMTRTDYKGNPVNEYGGIAESLLALNRITGVPEYLRLARVFMRDWFIEPLAAGEDRLEGLHANTHVPQATSFALAGPLTGDERLRKAAHNFWRQVTERHSFALGGNAFDEKFKAPGVEAEFLTDLSAETCNTHNMLKLTRALFEQEPDCAYADYFEHALYNHILASIAPDTGNTTYHLSVKPGHFKVYGTHDQSMWCCTGSGIENTARYAEAIYFIGTNTIWVNLYIPSSLELPEQGMKLVQESRFPADDKITFKLSCKQPVKLQINLRLPGWLAAPAAIRINGIGLQANEIPAPGHYLPIAREWRDGDTVDLRLPMALRTRPAMDHAEVVSFFYGPVLLAGGLGTRDMPPSDAAIRQTEFHNLPVPLVPRLASTTTSALTPVPGKPLHFTAKIAGEPGERSTQSFVPFYEMHHQRYSIYWRSK